MLFILFALVSSFADKNRSWFFAQRYELLITTTTIIRDTLFYGGNLFNITKMFSHYFQDTRENVTGFCGEVAYSMQISSNSYVLYSILTCQYIMSRAMFLRIASFYGCFSNRTSSIPLTPGIMNTSVRN